MNRRGERVASSEWCRAADGESGGGLYHAYGYLLKPDGTVKRETISLGTMPPAVDYPVSLTREVLGRLSRTLRTSVGIDDVAAVAVTRSCANEKHRLPMHRPTRVERVATLVIANTIEPVPARVYFDPSVSGGVDIGEVTVRSGAVYTKRPIVYQPLTGGEDDYPISDLAFVAPKDGGLPPVYVAWHDKLDGQAQVLVDPALLR